MYSLDLMFRYNKENFRPHDFHIHFHRIKFSINFDNGKKKDSKKKNYWNQPEKFG